jgi:Flp pilus assembly protein TadG
MENAGMIKRSTEGLGWANRLEDERGAALIELALCLPVALVLVFGVIEFSQIIFDEQIMSGLSRQGSDLSSRGTTLATTVSALGAQGGSLNMGTQGAIIITEVANNSSGAPQIVDQAESATGISVTSNIGSGAGNPATVPANAITLLNDGETLFVTEVFYSYTPMTPVGSFLKMNLTSTLYDVAYF